MRILSVIETFGHAGAETVLVDLVLGLERHEHRVLHFSTANGETPHRPFLDALDAAGVPCIDAHWSCIDSDAARREVLGDFVPDVVLFHWWGNDPWLTWVRGVAADPDRPRFVTVLHRAGFRPAAGYDQYVVVCEHQRPQVSHVAPDRIRCIPNGVDLQRFPEPRPRASVAPPSPPGTRGAARLRRAAERGGFGGPFEAPQVVIGRLSSLRESKIPRDFVPVTVGWGVAGAHYVVAGEGALRSALAGDARRTGHESLFSFPGYVSRAAVPALLATFDVFCYTTAHDLEECHPLALLEALAAGVPIVAEARGGIPEIVSHGVNGLLGHSSGEVGAHLRAIAADHEMRAALARGARESARRFSLAGQLAAWDELLDAVPSVPWR